MNYQVIYKPENKNLFVINNGDNDFVRFAMLVEPENQVAVSQIVIDFLKEQDTNEFKNNMLFSLEMVRIFDFDSYKLLKEKVISIDTIEKLEIEMSYFNIARTNDLAPLLFSFSKEFFDTFAEGVTTSGISAWIIEKVEIVKQIRSIENRIDPVSLSN